MATKLRAATRMELLAIKKKIKLATKGHKLLKQKRDALISEFFSLVDGLKKTRKDLENQINVAFKSLILAQAVNGREEVERAAGSAEKINPISVSHKTIMGVKAPIFKWEKKENKISYSMLSTSTELDTASTNFSNVLETLIKLAEIESTVKSLANEIKKTKRKVNALERILIPRLHYQATYIIMRLEEMERENFSRLKMIKKRIS
jgi:V/A-type H+/Na+-transporting ATPase subunit D